MIDDGDFVVARDVLVNDVGLGLHDDVLRLVSGKRNRRQLFEGLRVDDEDARAVVFVGIYPVEFRIVRDRVHVAVEERAHRRAIAAAEVHTRLAFADLGSLREIDSRVEAADMEQLAHQERIEAGLRSAEQRGGVAAFGAFEGFH